MKFTGERFIPGERGKIRLEHIHRYAVVINLLKDKIVLDLASGEGYGAAMLADVALSVTGVDLSTEAISHASNTYRKENLFFIEGSAANLRFDDESFDVVVSFETIEHISEQEQMLAEIRRVLKPDGFLVISSPNRPVYSEESGERNEFHVKELDFSELNAALTARFDQVQYYGQRMLMGSVIQDINKRQPVSRIWCDNDESLSSELGPLTDSVYFLAVCGSQHINLPNLGTTLVFPEKLDLVKHYVAFAKWAQTLSVAVSERDDQVRALRQTLTARESQLSDTTQLLQKSNEQLANLTSTLRRRSQWAFQIDADLQNAKSELEETRAEYEAQLSKIRIELQQLENELQRTVNSHSWKITHPLRNSRRQLSFFSTRIRRFRKYPFLLAKRIYQLLPIPSTIKDAQRSFIAGTVPRLLLLSGTPESTIPKSNHGQHDRGSNKNDIPVLRNTNKTLIISSSSPQKPLVSIIIPVFGKLDYTLRCLSSIEEYLPGEPFEIIVVDDCSSDCSFESLSEVGGIRLIRNSENLGFIRSCNNGARIATGQYLLFLNNDTEVRPGWLDELVRTFDVFPETGLAGSKLLYPDGRLQEAGGIIWSDGSAWNFGRFQDPDLPIFNYAREVDYCSGASIMIPKFLFDELGGFDEHYLPAYCEDSDLALKIRDKGYRVIYQPLSCVVHHEGVTSGTDINQGIKSYQVENMKKVFNRWKHRLETHQPPGVSVDAAKDRRAKYRALFLDHCTPTPDQDSGSIDAFNQMLLLREMDFQVTFIPEDNFLFTGKYTKALQRCGIEVLYSPYVSSLEEHLKEFGARYDLIVMSRVGVAERSLQTVRRYCGNGRVWFHTVDLHFFRMSREATLKGDVRLEILADQVMGRERFLIKSCDVTTVVSTEEMAIFRDDLDIKEKVRLLPYARHVRGTKKRFSERHDVVFIGGYQHTPNVDAVFYFVSEIMPILRKQSSNFRFFIVGSCPTEEILRLACDDVIVLGYVENLEKLLDSIRVSVAPLRYGAGIKGKIGTSMTLGLPVVATPLAVEGMSLTTEENILVADTAEAFAEAVIRLYSNEFLWNRISENGIRFSENTWGAEAAWGTFAAILSDLGFSVIRTTHPLTLYSDSLDFRAHDPANPKPIIRPIAIVKSKKEFDSVLGGDLARQLSDFEERILSEANTDTFAFEGFCLPCNQRVLFLVDSQSGAQDNTGKWLPNWRERLECPICSMNNRQRLIAALISQELSATRGRQIYFMEQVTPIFRWAESTFKQHTIFGSEYLGFEYASGTLINGVRHEDVAELSFSDNQLDLIVSNDVFEHVPFPGRAFSECARVLKPGGYMLATIPFHSGSDRSFTRAELAGQNLEYHCPAIFHGNPVSKDGSLVFTDFGWDVLDAMCASGFSDVAIEMFASAKFGHLGGSQLVFRCEK